MTGTTRRGRGTRAGLDRERILNAARDLDPATLTMQQVAEDMGVGDSYHVTPVGVLFGQGGPGGDRVEDPYFGGAGPARNAYCCPSLRSGE